MPSIRISKEFTSGIYYLTFTVRNWYYLFDRHNRFDILANSLQYCQKHKGLNLYSYVFMLNHIHLIASSPDMIGFVRDFKKFTSKEIQKIGYGHLQIMRVQSKLNRHYKRGVQVANLNPLMGFIVGAGFKPAPTTFLTGFTEISRPLSS